MTEKQFLTSRDTLLSKHHEHEWPPQAREAVAAALYASSTEGAGNVMTWPKFCAHHGQEYEGVARFYRRADAAIAALAPFLAAQIKRAYQDGWNDREGDLLASVDRIYGQEQKP